VGAKQRVVTQICLDLGVTPLAVSTGAKEPKALLLAANERLGLGLSPSLSKPELARRIVEAAGVAWTDNCHARGNTITITGLTRIQLAIQLLSGQADAAK
jgi:hypothetical protein